MPRSSLIVNTAVIGPTYYSWDESELFTMIPEEWIYWGTVCRQDNRITAGPYQLKIFEKDYSRLAYLCYRDSWAGRRAALKLRIKRHAEMLKWRLIRKLNHLGLAHTKEGVEYQWHDIDMVRKLNKRERR